MEDLLGIRVPSFFFFNYAIPFILILNLHNKLYHDFIKKRQQVFPFLFIFRVTFNLVLLSHCPDSHYPFSGTAGEPLPSRIKQRRPYFLSLY